MIKEDINVKIGTEEESAWTNIKKSAEKELKDNKRAIIIGEEIIKLAERMIKKTK